MIDTARLLVTGSREWHNEAQVASVLGAAWAELSQSISWRNVVLVHGACPTGVDHIAQAFWTSHDGTDEPHAADWNTHGRSAGPRRNSEMVALGADLCLAFFQRGAANRGTNDCASKAKAAGIPTKEIWSHE